ncbi:MAG: hypothetical protein JW822_14545 [Spirochaetales bacterium]|nr:hypothetical protein [Spirochaetales bacterium]
MKRAVCGFCLILCVLSSLCAQDTELVLHRVYFEPVNHKTQDDKELLSAVPEMLYSLITINQPIIKTDFKEAARSIVITTVTKSGANQITVLIELKRGNENITTVNFSYTADKLNYAAFKGFLETTARKFSPYLGKVEPEVKITSLIKDVETKDTIKAVQFAEAMARPFELCLWVGSILKANTSDVDEMTFTLRPQIRIPFPMELDMTWYFERQQGLMVTLYFDYNDYMFFGEDPASPDDAPAKSDNMIILVGAGYVFRTLGVFSTSYSVSLLVGAVNVTAKTDLENNDSGQISLSKGESTWLFFALLPLRISFSYNISPDIAIQTNLSFIFNPYIFFSMLSGINLPYEGQGSAVQIQFVSLGAAYRF